MPDEENGSKVRLDLKTLATIIGMLVIGSGVVASWATNKAEVIQLKENYAKLEQEFKDYKEKSDAATLQMKLDITSSSGDIRTIKEDISEIKTDVKALLDR